MDKDSLYNTFMNFEKKKMEATLLKKDTAILRGIVRRVELSNSQLKLIIKNNDSIIVPKYETIISNLEQIVKNEEKNAKKKYWKGARDVGGFSLLLFLILGIL